MSGVQSAGPSPHGGGPAPSRLSDGYGDELTVDEQLAQYEAWLHAVANRILPPADHRHDDLVQEGRIGMWKALASYDPARGALPSYLTRGAEMQMRQAFMRGENWTGSPSRRGNHMGEVQVRHLESVEALLDDGSQHVEEAAGVAADVAEAAMLAYHRGEVAEAVRLLPGPQRDYLRLRFVEDRSGPEIQRELGVGVTTLWHAPRSGARDRLRAQLRHLEAVA